MMDHSEAERLTGDEVATQALLGALIVRVAALSKVPATELNEIHDAVKRQISSIHLHGIAPLDPNEIKKYANAFVANVFRGLDIL